MLKRKTKEQTPCSNTVYCFVKHIHVYQFTVNCPDYFPIEGVGQIVMEAPHLPALLSCRLLYFVDSVLLALTDSESLNIIQVIKLLYLGFKEFL